MGAEGGSPFLRTAGAVLVVMGAPPEGGALGGVSGSR